MQIHTPETMKNLTDTQPGEIYETPEKLLAATHVSREKKAKLLAQWASDLEAKLIASDENMAGTEPGQTGDMLRRVKDAQRALEAASH